jgi:hypothetical protein
MLLKLSLETFAKSAYLSKLPPPDVLSMSCWALGYGTDHEYNMKEGSVKLAYMAQPSPRSITKLADRKVIKVACGHNHVVVVDSLGKGRSLLIAGS